MAMRRGGWLQRKEKDETVQGKDPIEVEPE